MKKYLLYITILFSVSIFSQRTGISYQALILNPNGEQLPGYNNQKSPLINQDICLEFSIVDDRTIEEYVETQSVKTDSYGMVNLIIGTGSFEGGFAGSWDKVIWSEKSKKLKVRLDISGSCSSYTEISNQELTSVPFALFAPGSDLKQPLFKTTLESAGVNCTNGGIKIEAGADENENNVLDSSEIDSALTKYVCNGAPGKQGEQAKKILVLTTAEAAGANCANGGVKIEIGTDTNGDSTLDADEIDTTLTKYVCNGVNGNDGNSDGANQFFSSFSEVASEVTYAQVPYDSYSNVITASGSWWTGVNGDIFEDSYGKTYFNANLPDLITYELDNPSSEMLLDFNNSTNRGINNTQSCYKLKASIEFLDSNDSPIKVYTETKKGTYAITPGTSDTRYLPIITSYETSDKHIAELGESALNLYHYQIKFITEKTPSKVILKFYSDPSSITYSSNACTEDIYKNGISTGLDGKWLNIRFGNGGWWGPIGFILSKWE